MHDRAQYLHVDKRDKEFGLTRLAFLEPSQFKYPFKHVVSTIHRALLTVTLPHYPYEHVIAMTHDIGKDDRQTRHESA